MSEPTQNFSQRQLGWMRRWRSQAHLRTACGARPQSVNDWSQLLLDIENKISKDSFRFEGLRWHFIRGKQALTSSLLEDTLVIRKINDNIRKSYGIRQPNRTALIRTAKQAIRENAPKTIIRIDLKSCYESIDRAKLLKELRIDARVSTQTIALLNTLFEEASNKCPTKMPQGIPRGMSVSTSLAELKLCRLDHALRNIEGTYLLLRYVDDILIFTTAPPKQATEEARKVIVEQGLKLNEKKSHSLRVCCKCDDSCPHGSLCPCGRNCVCQLALPDPISIEYLGYKLIFSPHNQKDKKKANDVHCLISDRKISKIKTRLVRALQDYKITADQNLLARRVKYLTSNQLIASDPGKRGLLSGLSYTHSEYSEPSINGSIEGTLAELDQFYRTNLRKYLKAAPPTNLQNLERLTFSSGFKHHRRTKFTGLEVKQIQKCWSP